MLVKHKKTNNNKVQMVIQEKHVKSIFHNELDMRVKDISTMHIILSLLIF